MSKPNLTDAEFDKLLQGMGPGSKEVETSWPDPHDWDSQPVLQGQVVELESVTLPDRTSRRATIKHGDQEVSLWESASLRKFFDELKPGDHVLVQFNGFKDLPGGRTQRQFRVARKGGK